MEMWRWHWGRGEDSSSIMQILEGKLPYRASETAMIDWSVQAVELLPLKVPENGQLRLTSRKCKHKNISFVSRQTCTVIACLFSLNAHWAPQTFCHKPARPPANHNIGSAQEQWHHAWKSSCQISISNQNCLRSPTRIQRAHQQAAHEVSNNVIYIKQQIFKTQKCMLFKFKWNYV